MTNKHSKNKYSMLYECHLFVRMKWRISWHLTLFIVQKYDTYGSIYDFNSRRRNKSSNYISLTVLCFHMSFNQIDVMFSSQIQHCSIHNILNTKQTTNIMVSLACIISVTLENKAALQNIYYCNKYNERTSFDSAADQNKITIPLANNLFAFSGTNRHKPRNSTMKSKSSRPAQTIVI